MEECAICFDDTTDFLFYRCAHKVCAQCFPKIKTCPFCNTPQIVPQIVIIEPINQPQVSEIATTYNLIRCIGSFFIMGGFAIFFYRDK